MSLSSGTRVGPYEIQDRIGAGGMGEVYRARDSRLDRDVAIKVLPDVFGDDAERLARFGREAKTLASLNHPHIAQVFGLEQLPSTRSGQATISALVMELVDGEDLAQRIARGPIAIDEAIPIARQIAEALEAAHEQGIIHRDLKPANIKVRLDGTVKVLDFGLAKAMPSATGAGVTALTAATDAGMILGTAAYMSPEQARGKPIDKRADVWAFGIVLYEMLTGLHAFSGETASDTIAAVLTRSPGLSHLPAHIPSHVRQLLSRCLVRDASQRMRDIGEARIALSDSSSSVVDVVADRGATTERASDRRPWTPLTIALLILSIASLALAGYAWFRASAPEVAENFEVAIAPPPDRQFAIGSNSGNVIVSPDGTKIAFVALNGARSQLWVRSLSRDDARPLSGTEGAYYPFWAPDSRRLGFFANLKVRVVTLDAGLPTVVSDLPIGRGGTWTEDGNIIVARTGVGLARMPESGGTVEDLTKLDLSRGENAHYWPQAIPGSRDYLYFVRSAIPENNGIYLGHLDGRPPSRLISSLSNGIYAPPLTAGRHGHMLWWQDGKLLGQTLNLPAATLEGSVTSITAGVRVEDTQRIMFASVSNNGILAWADARGGELALGLFDRTGNRIKALPLDPGRPVTPEFSPDGKKIALSLARQGSSDVWIHDIASGTNTPVTSTPTHEEWPSWSPDSQSVVYLLHRPKERAMMIARIDGSLPARPAISGEIGTRTSFTPDGRALLFGAAGTRDLTIVPLVGGGKTVTASVSDDELTGGAVRLSPDGRWLAVTTSAGPGTTNVYVIRVTRDGNALRIGGQRITVATNGSLPRWSGDGRELFYETRDGDLMSVKASDRGEMILFSTPTRLMSLRNGDWDISPDGNRIVAVEAPYAEGQTIKVLTNWRQRLQ